jgi:hypothetical protein
MQTAPREKGKGKMKNKLLTGILLSLFSGSAVMAANRPNIVFILADDHAWDVMGHRGDPVAKTPHLDQMASDGVSFLNVHHTSPICLPSRASGKGIQRHVSDGSSRCRILYGLYREVPLHSEGQESG